VSALVEFLDTAGPMARTVRDAVLVLDALVGYDPGDDYTAAYLAARPPDRYADLLDANVLEGARIGVLRQLFGHDGDPDRAAVDAVIEQALAVMGAAGATLVDVEIPGLDDLMASTALYLTHSRHDLDRFLAARPDLPYSAIADIVRDAKYHPALEWLKAMSEGPLRPSDDPAYFPKMAAREHFQRAVVNAMARAGVAVLAYPTVGVVAPTRAELDAGRWTVEAFPTNTMIASQAGLPAVTVPAGVTRSGPSVGLPVGLEILGLPYDEPTVLKMAYAFEQRAQARVVPGRAATSRGRPPQVPRASVQPVRAVRPAAAAARRPGAAACRPRWGSRTRRPSAPAPRPAPPAGRRFAGRAHRPRPGRGRP
jgi:Asp-tRNA(Asn)/Glu-tRNA(Gln) amidotransferase A subunit family amidase